MLFVSESSSGISDDGRVIAKIVRESRRTLDTSVCSHADDDYILDVSLTQLVVEVGALK